VITMKKMRVLFASAVLVCVGISVHTSADAQVQVSPVVSPVVARLVASTVKGTITVPVNPGQGLTGFKCENLVVFATSKDQTTPPEGGGFSSPKWTRHTLASGNWASGSCSYAMIVPANSAFVLSANGSGPFECDVIPAFTTGTGGWLTVAKAGSKMQNFTISSLKCEIIG
jgi:hypothetical protein